MAAIADGGVDLVLDHRPGRSGLKPWLTSAPRVAGLSIPGRSRWHGCAGEPSGLTAVGMPGDRDVPPLTGLQCSRSAASAGGLAAQSAAAERTAR